ncbi:MAG: hypothetical protein K2Y23_01165 [Cyanobacteria bacterium]|nr:hypothetical protein [Cyanobacteriota bacterium]
MILLWSIAMGGFLIALAALMIARRTARQLADVTHMYWQLKFDHGELKAKVDPSQPAPPEPKATFVPLSRLRQGSGEAGSE